jgi:hypothetical protein
MRGQKNFNDLIKTEGLHASARRGRSNSLLTKRNECLMARYYYYGTVKNKIYEEIVRLLVAEFFLSPNTLAYLIQGGADQVQMLKRNCPSLYYFQSRWPHLKW